MYASRTKSNLPASAPSGFSSMDLILDFETLQRATGYTRVGDVSKCLERQGIRFFHGRKGVIWTTAELVSRAAGYSGGNAKDDGPILPIEAFG